MPRVAIEELEHYGFVTELPVRVTDLNYGAHLAYDRLLGLVHEARMRLLGTLDVSESDLGEGIGLVAGDVAVVYKGEAFWGDSLKIDIQPVEIRGGSFRLSHRITHADGRLVALAEIGFVAFNYRARKASRLPKSFVESLQKVG